MSSPGYGITAIGYDLKNKTRQEAMTIAVDPKKIPLGSKVLLIFDAPYEDFSGVYTARDVGGAIKGNRIDLFMGDFRTHKTSQMTMNFGRRKALAIVLSTKE